MLTRIHTSTLTGIEAVAVEVEAEVVRGKQSFVIIGLADSAVRESRDRVTAAVKHSGFTLPERILINLAPAEVKKEGAAFDLPIAISILAASRQLRLPPKAAVALHGELALDGRLKPVRGILALTLEARARGLTDVIVPWENYQEAALVSGIRVHPARVLLDAVAFFRGQVMPEPPELELRECARGQMKLISEVWGQENAKRALVIAAAGGHNLIMVGPPGCGKSMLAERFPSLLPPLAEQEIVETVRVHSVAGQPVTPLLAGQRPFRSPHHVVSDVGLIGGGAQPRPGEISLANRGVLFLDEFPEFRRSALESLRGPLEAGQVLITRAKASIRLPARFQLLAAMNPCPCGRLGVKGVACTCSRPAILAYLRKLSQPILDRIDIHVELSAVDLSTVAPSTQREHAARLDEELRERVAAARVLQNERQSCLNAELQGSALMQQLDPSGKAQHFLRQACDQRGLSTRAYVRILRVARTIADLESAACIEVQHIAEAISYRTLERIERYCLAA